MKYGVRKSSQFKKSLKRMVRRGKDIAKLTKVVLLLAEGTPLPPEYKDHPLTGNHIGLRDCHIENDWVLLYYYEADNLILVLSDTGSHADCLE